MRLRISDIARELSFTSPDLITRRMGEAMYHLLREKIAGLAPDEVLTLDFEGIQVIDTSFIDEFIVKLAYDSRGRTHPFYVKLSNITDIMQVNINSVFSSHAQYTAGSFAVLTDRLMPNNSYYLGRLTPNERDVINYLSVNKSAHVSEIADFLSRSTLETAEIVESLAGLRLIRQSGEPGAALITPL